MTFANHRPPVRRRRPGLLTLFAAAAALTPLTPAAAADRRAPATFPSVPEVSVEEWMRVERFMAEASPRKWAMYHSLPEKGKLRSQLKHQIVQRYLVLQRLKREDAARHELEVAAIRIEDEVYGILQDARGGRMTDADTDAALRRKVDELVRNRDEWRVERLRRVLRELESIGGAKDALGPIQAEIRRWSSLGPDARQARVNKRVEDYKSKLAGAAGRPRLGKSLPGEPVGSQPATDADGR